MGTPLLPGSGPAGEVGQEERRQRDPGYDEPDLTAARLNYGSHSTDSGAVFSQWPESVTPLANWAQALVVAVLCASIRLAADAVRQSRWPLNTMQTLQLTRSPWKVVQTTNPTTTTTNATASQTVLFM
jgi:hypothetical protein